MLNDAQRKTLAALVDMVVAMQKTSQSTAETAPSVQAEVESWSAEDVAGVAGLLDVLAIYGFARSSVRSRQQTIRTISFASTPARGALERLQELALSAANQASRVEEVAK